MIKKIRSSLTVKIFLITGALLTIVCALTYGFIAWFMPKTYSDHLSNDLAEQSQKLVEALKKLKLEDSEEAFEQFILKNNAYVQVLDAQKNVVPLPLNIGQILSDDRVVISVTVSEANITQDIQDIDVVNSFTYSSAISTEYGVTFAGSDAPYTLVVTGGTQAVNQVVNALQNILPWLIVTILSISVLGALFYSHYVTRPIVRLSGISQRMAELDFEWQCGDTRRDEIGVLSRSLDELSARLSDALSKLRKANSQLKNDIDRERQMEQKRMEFFSAVSHELKTPITVIKGQLEGMLGGVGVYSDRDRYLARALTVAGSMESMVQELLAISRMESPAFVLHTEIFDFAEMVRGKLAEHLDLLEQRGLTLEADIPEHLSAKADSLLLAKALSSLLSNAANYSPPGQKIRVFLRTAGRDIRLSLENTGAYIPEELLPRVFEAFYRVDTSRNRQSGGSGLGLYIVKVILELHGADYHIENFREGVRFSFTLK